MSEYSMHQSPYDYKLLSFIITSHHHLKPIDVTQNISMFEIVEELHSPTLSGSFIMVDDMRFFDGVRFNGTEKCEITLSSPAPDGVPITLNFIIRHLKGSQKVQDQKEMLDFSIVEETGFNNEIRKLSKAYSGTSPEIISKILKDGLGLDLEFPQIKPAQSPIKIVVPFMSPFQACNWVLGRMSTSNGMPYFLFRTIKSKKIQLKSLEEMLTTNPWNKSPYVFSIANAQSQPQASGTIDSVNLFNVEEYHDASASGMLHNISSGTIGSRHTVTDVTSGQTETFQMNVNSLFDELQNTNVITEEEKPLLHTNYSFQDQELANHNSLNIHRVVLNNTYNDYKNIYEEDTKASFRLDAVSGVVKSLMRGSRIEVAVPGSPFLVDEHNRTLGTRFNFHYVANKTDPEENEDGSIMKDLERSGIYTIHSARHLFFEQKHKTTLLGFKLGREKT